jgi:peptide/nickel transport system substrate-binding protein
MKSNAMVMFLAFVLPSVLLVAGQGGTATTPDKKVVIAVAMEPGTVDPTLMSSGGDRTTLENWGEYLIYKAPSGDLKPGLATSWKVSPDGKQIEFTLRKGVRFHNGDPMTSKDVAFSFERVRTKNPQGPSRLGFIERLEVIDDYRIKIHFKTPDVTFIPNRCEVPIASKSYYDRVGEDKFIKEPVGTGPYKVVRYEPGQSVDIERFDGYWDEKPTVKEARFVFVSEDTTRVAKLKAGEVDFISAVPYPSVKELENSGYKLIKLAVNHPTPSIAFANRNPKAPWYDRRVRMAMAYAIDCDAIIKNLLNGIPNRWAFLAPYELGYDPTLKPYPYDPKKARELLAEAGYPKGFEFSLYYPLGHRLPMIREIAEAIAAYFEAVGIKTKLVGEEQAAYRARQRAAQGSKAAEAVFVNWGTGGRAGSVDPSQSLYVYFSKEGGFSVYTHPEAEPIIDEAKMTADDTKRGELIKKAVRIVHEDVASIPVFNNVIVYAMKKNVDFRPTEKFQFDVLFVKDITVK